MPFTEFTVRAGGNNMNAGSLDGINQAATTPTVTATNGGWNQGTGVFTAASGTPFSGVSTGQWASVNPDMAIGNTVFTGRITAVGGGGANITISLTAKSGTAPTTAGSGYTCRVGGAWVGPGGVSGSFPFDFVQPTMIDTSNNAARINFKDDITINVTSGISHTIGGAMFFEGYTTSFGDGGYSTIDGGSIGASYTLFNVTVSNCIFERFKFVRNGSTGSADLVTNSGGSTFINCTFSSGRGSGLHITTAACNVHRCEAYSNNPSNTANRGGFSSTVTGTLFTYCNAHDNTGGTNSDGFSCASGNPQITFDECWSDTNGGVGFRTGAGYMDKCDAYNNTGSGATVSLRAIIRNSRFVSNGGYGIDGNVQQLNVQKCAFYNNTSGQVNSVVGGKVVSSITLSGSPYIDAANGDFRSNATAGAGAACRGTGDGMYTQTASSYAGTVGFPDIGVGQHQEVTLPPSLILHPIRRVYSRNSIYAVRRMPLIASKIFQTTYIPFRQPSRTSVRPVYVHRRINRFFVSTNTLFVKSPQRVNVRTTHVTYRMTRIIPRLIVTTTLIRTPQRLYWKQQAPRTRLRAFPAPATNTIMFRNFPVRQPMRIAQRVIQIVKQRTVMIPSQNIRTVFPLLNRPNRITNRNVHNIRRVNRYIPLIQTTTLPIPPRIRQVSKRVQQIIRPKFVPLPVDTRYVPIKGMTRLRPVLLQRIPTQKTIVVPADVKQQPIVIKRSQRITIRTVYVNRMLGNMLFRPANVVQNVLLTRRTFVR